MAAKRLPLRICKLGSFSKLALLIYSEKDEANSLRDIQFRNY